MGQENVKVNPKPSAPRGLEAICFPGYRSKITNYNTQITNNIKIINSNELTISITYWMYRRHFICFEF